MKYKAEIKLKKEGGRKEAIRHSPFLGHIKFNEADAEGFSVKVFFDDTVHWEVGESMECRVEFLHYDIFPVDLRGDVFTLFDGRVIGNGRFASS
ncbi:hypothetical protein OEW28_10415 [Defluviimonas sp. WL0002]|uniref:DUF2442 domain-containing protein n=1 Tax=Albidovulum marisflavi TaxID=2984159 RepID=A0ABT2ZD37_9RHOB|nr:hypothetical protein [Defluviimonas sp. WL0002]MCV2869039.1 hypothetical protein [Defluviimonas sp. WL0002]